MGTKTWIGDGSLAPLWADRVAQRPDDLFLVTHQRAWSASEFDRLITVMRERLLAAGARAGDAVAIQGPNDASRLALHFAVQIERLVAVPLLGGLTEAECSRILDHCSPRFVATTLSGSAAYGEVTFAGEDMIILDRSSEMCDAGRSALAEVVATGAGWIIYTSGSTGSPKGVVLPRTSLASCGYGYSNGFGIGSGDRMLLCFPLGHAIGTHTAPGVALVSGATLALVEKFSVSRFWSDVEALGGTCMVLFPSQLTLLSEAKSAETVTGSPLRLVLTHQIHGPFQQRFPQIELGTVWGMTETGAVATGHRGGTLDDPNLVGGPLVPDAAVQILNPSGTPVPDGDVGEIAFRHPAGQMICYFREPELTAATLVDGYVRTGDLGVIGPKGLSFSGRVKNIIKRAGETIVADEVEHCVAQHDLVQECAVASVPDRVLTEEVGAVVCAREGADPLVIREWLRDHLAAWKLPRYWIVSSEPLPRLENHKVDRRMVADMLADQGLRLDLGERR